MWSQIFRYESVALNVAKYFSVLLIVAELQVNVCKKSFLLYVFFEIYSCLVQSPLFTLPHFPETDSFILYIACPQRIEFSLLTAAFDNVFREKWTYLLTRTMKVKASHCFEQSVAMNIENPSTLTV